MQQLFGFQELLSSEHGAIKSYSYSGLQFWLLFHIQHNMKCQDHSFECQPSVPRAQAWETGLYANYGPLHVTTNHTKTLWPRINHPGATERTVLACIAVS